MPNFAKAADTLGSVHYSHFIVAREKLLIFLADSDGEFAPGKSGNCTNRTYDPSFVGEGRSPVMHVSESA
jgi:hypothetical protein